MNILWITNSIYPYRSRVFNTIRMAHNLDLITLGPQYAHGGKVHSNFYQKHSYRFKLPLRSMIAIKQYDFIVISGWDAAGYFAIALLAIKFKIPHTLLFESTLDSSKHKRGFIAIMRRWIFKRISTVLTLSVLAHEAALEYCGNQDEKIIKSRNWFDNENFVYMESLSQKTGYVYIYVGRLIPQKGIERMIRAFYQVAKNDDQLLIIGEGPERKRLLPLCLDSRVIFTGLIEHDKLSTLLSQSNALIFPTFNDVYGFPCLEALSCGLGVVVSKKAGIWKDIHQLPGVIVFDENLTEALQEIKEYKPNREYVDLSDFEVKRVLGTILNAYIKSSQLIKMGNQKGN